MEEMKMHDTDNPGRRIRIYDKLLNSFEVTEAIKALRTNIIFSGEERRSIGLTSCGAAEGKTTLSLNLASALAIDGKQTVLLDTDMRRSVLARYAGLKTRIDGLGQYLTGQCSVKDIIYTTDIPNLCIIFAGTRVANPAELLGSKRLQELVAGLKTTFSYIVADTPPLGRVIDCAIMAPIIDDLLIVVDTEKNSYRGVQAVKAQYEKANGKILGVVLNKCNFKDKSSYYGRTYGYGYDY